MSEQSVLNQYFIFGQLLGKGSFAIVFQITDRKTKNEFAMKIIDKNQSVNSYEQILKEVYILKKIRHKNVIRLYECYETKEKIYMQMEYGKGGVLFDRIVNLGYYDEDSAKKIARQILEAVAYLHSQGVVHRDLKPENLIMSDYSDDALVKIADFGLSTLIPSHEMLMKTSCGTLAYAAPEILNGVQYGPAVDLWSVGVIFYNLLSGYPPFWAKDERLMRAKIRGADFQFYSPDWDEVSGDAKTLISGLIEIDQTKRLSPTQALNHKWFSESIETKNLASIVSDNLVKHFNAKRTLKAGADAVQFVVKGLQQLQVKKSKGAVILANEPAQQGNSPSQTEGIINS